MWISCTAVSNHLIHIVPVSHLKTSIQGDSNIITLNWKNYLIITIIRLVIIHENLHYG